MKKIILSVLTLAFAASALATMPTPVNYRTPTPPKLVAR